MAFAWMELENSVNHVNNRKLRNHKTYLFGNRDNIKYVYRRCDSDLLEKKCKTKGSE